MIIWSLFSLYNNWHLIFFIFLSTEYITYSCAVFKEYRELSETDLEAIGLYLEYRFQQETIGGSYPEIIENLRNESWSGTAADTRVSYYRQCTQASWFHSSTLLPPPIDTKFGINFFTETCYDIFGGNFTPETIYSANNYTNSIFNGANPNVENVYFTYGEQDPNRLLGPSEDLSASVFVDFIPGYGKLSNVFRSEYTTDAGVATVQARARALIVEWIQG